MIYPGYMLVSSKITTDASPLDFSLNGAEARNTPQEEGPANTEKRTRVIKNLSENEGGGKAKAAGASHNHTKALPLLI